MSLVPKKLQEVDRIYREVENSLLRIIPSTDHHDQSSLRSSENMRASVERSEQALERFRDVFPHLTTDEIVMAFRYGSGLLRRNIAGHMARDIFPAYVPVMIETVRNSHDPLAPMFLYALAYKAPEEGTPLLRDALESTSAPLREQAIYLIGELYLIEFRPKISARLTDDTPSVRYAAQRILERWAASEKS